ncbi:MAG TPA: ribosome biogenesis factor YjgA [Burkholderiales bacterium]|nr:ribosome biogenesis factor YjgA [Burkholderiales bacterium]
MFDDEKPSKTRRKKDMHALQALGEALVELRPEQLEGVDMPEALRDAVLEAKRLTRHEARRRQMQYIGKLMREVDAAPIRAKLDELAGRSATATAALHRVERWRDRLIEDEQAFNEFAQTYPHADLQPVRTAVREVRKERAASRPPRHYRELFRLLKAIDESRGHADAD